MVVGVHGGVGDLSVVVGAVASSCPDDREEGMTTVLSSPSTWIEVSMLITIGAMLSPSSSASQTWPSVSSLDIETDGLAASYGGGGAAMAGWFCRPVRNSASLRLWWLIESEGSMSFECWGIDARGSKKGKNVVSKQQRRRVSLRFQIHEISVRVYIMMKNSVKHKGRTTRVAGNKRTTGLF
jgi:hypothetical protein